MSTALHSPASTAATAAIPSAASEITKPLRSSARRMSRRDPASSSTMSTWIGMPPLMGMSGDLRRSVQRFELGERDRALRAQLRHGADQVLDVAAARRMLDLPRDGGDVRRAEIGGRTLQRVRRACDGLRVVDLETVVDVGEQLGAVVAVQRDEAR